MSQLRQHQVVQGAQRDINNIIAEGERMLKEANLHVADGWVRRFIASEAALNPELTRAFDARYESHENLQHAEKLVKQALNKMRAEARAMPDPGATADRDAVVAAMRTSASNYDRVPEQKLPDFANMTDNEFLTTRRRMFGY